MGGDAGRASAAEGKVNEGVSLVWLKTRIEEKKGRCLEKVSQPVTQTCIELCTGTIDERTAYQNYGWRSDANFKRIEQGLHDKRLTRRDYRCPCC